MPYELLTRKALKALNKEQALVVISLGPIEVHANFLPLGTDFIESIAWAELLLKPLLKERRSNIQYTLVYVPPLPIGTGALRGMQGTLDIGHRTFRDCVTHYIDGLIKAGFRRFLILTAHHGLTHAHALEEVVDKLMRRYKKLDVRIGAPVNFFVQKIFVDDPKKTWVEYYEKLGQKPFSEEEFQGAYDDHHSSIMETSFMKFLNSGLVDPEYKTAGAHVEGNFHGILSHLGRRWANLGGADGCGYNGNPSLTDTRDWFALYKEMLSDLTLEFVDALYHKDKTKFAPYRHSRQWKILMLRTNFKQYIAIPLIIAILLGSVFSQWWWIFLVGYLVFFGIFAFYNFRVIKGLKE